MQLLHWLSWTGYQLGINAPIQNSRGANQEMLSFPTTDPSPNSRLRNYAALIPSATAQLEVGEVPYPELGEDELIIKNYVVAVNPVDWKIQSSASSFNLTYPTILGEDAAGEVLEVGSSLKDKFKVGDRVMSHTFGLGKGLAYGGFQLYPVLIGATTSLIPDDISYAEAAVLPLSISTAAAGLFMNSTLSLKYPKTGKVFDHSVFDSGKGIPTLLLWGGSSSVGTSVIQLASAAGYAVITTASPSNFKLCKDLGAAYVVDYHNPDIVRKLINLLEGQNVVGAYDAIGSIETVHQNAAVLHALGGGIVASVGTAPDDLPSGVTVARMSSVNIVTQEPEVAKAIWGHYVPAALKAGVLVPSPKELIVGKGLKDVQKGLDRQKQGVSARKVEVLLG
jgi:NADPH:quinone reductase-like Zn-dependent oxidoreductase